MSNRMVSAQLEHGHSEARLHGQSNRIAAGIAWLIACASSSLSFVIMGWTAAQCTTHIAHIYVYGLMLAAVVQFVFAMVALFKGLDDLFYPRDDRRRITRSHSGRRANDQ